jgi:hypothetical protein
MSRNGIVQLGALGTLILGLLASTFLTVQIAASAGRNQLVYTDRLEGSMTREEALGVAAGAFRGMIVNMLWIRAQNLKQEGKYYEAVDLSKTITRLQPRFPRVWAFHAWNLAYNISVTTQTPQERWQWVNAGIRLLRDQGIPANPNDMLLHKELAWIFLHKMQMRMDDANNKYKEWFAREWTIVVGPPPEGVWYSTNRAANIEACAKRLENIAAAPDTLEELRAQYPRAGEIADGLKKDMGIDLATDKGRMSLLEFREYYRSAARRAQLLKSTPVIQSADPRLMKLFIDPGNAEALDALFMHLRKRVLIDTYKMEPDRMVRYTRKYGPMDWRHPAAHAVYWAARGVEQGLNRVQVQNAADFDFINTDRMVIHAVQELYRSGTVMYDIAMPQFFAQLPNPDFIQSYHDIIDELLAREEQQMKVTKGVDMKERAYRFYMEGYENFLGDAIVLLFRRNQLDEAKKYQMEMANFPGRNRNNDDRERIRNLPLEDYVLEVIRDREDTPYLAVQEVYGTLQNAYVYGLRAGDEDLFKQKLEYATRIHKAFWEKQYRMTNIDRDDPRMMGMDTDFWKFAGKVLFQLIRMVGVDDAALIYRRAPQEIQLWTYYLIDSSLPADAHDSAGMKNVNALYPEPRGYAPWKAQTEAAMKAIEKRGNNELK